MADGSGYSPATVDDVAAVVARGQTKPPVLGKARARMDDDRLAVSPGRVAIDATDALDGGEWWVVQSNAGDGWRTHWTPPPWCRSREEEVGLMAAFQRMGDKPPTAPPGAAELVDAKEDLEDAAHAATGAKDWALRARCSDAVERIDAALAAIGGGDPGAAAAAGFFAGYAAAKADAMGDRGAKLKALKMSGENPGRKVRGANRRHGWKDLEDVIAEWIGSTKDPSAAKLKRWLTDPATEEERKSLGVVVEGDPGEEMVSCNNGDSIALSTIQRKEFRRIRDGL